jgi:GT2 family glycosyltransferase
MFDLGDKEGELYEAPFGTNMAFRKAAFEKYGGFRADLGPRPGSEIRNEDTEFGQRVLRGGEKLGYVPSAVVYHEVAERRLRKEYFLAWWFDKARADVRQNGVPRRAQLLGVPLYLARRLMVWSVRWMAALTPSSRFACKLKVWGLVGEIRECYRLSRSRELPANSSARPA